MMTSAVKPERGRLRVSVASTEKYFIPRFLGSFCAAFPDVDIALEALNRDAFLQHLQQACATP